MESNDDDTFRVKVKSLYRTVSDYGNPFKIHDNNLLKHVIQEICDDSVEETIWSIELKGRKQYNSYVSKVLENGSETVHDRIPKNSYLLMSTALKKGNSTS